MEKKTYWPIILGIVAVALCLMTCACIVLAVILARSLQTSPSDTVSLPVGQAAPDFELTSLDGETVRLSRFQGRPVVLAFGATWCPSCRLSAPVLEEAHQNHPELVVLLVDINETLKVVQEHTQEMGSTHPVLLDSDGAVSDLYKIFAIPTAYFIDADGIIRALSVGQLTPEALAENLPLIGVTP
ncbi:MAG: TlpA family protein disulfide reductase [Chloroflexota bacterium]